MTFRKTINNLSFLIVLGIVMVSCDRTPEWILEENKNLSGQATVKVHNNIVNSSRNNIYVDNVNVTGSTGVMFYNPTSGSPSFPNTVYGFAVNAGSRTITIRDTSSASTQIPVTFTYNFEAGKNYTVFTYDSITRAKYKLVETPIVIPADDTTAMLRFANMITYPTAPPNVDIYSVKKKGNIFTNIPLGAITNYVPVRSSVIDTFYVRIAGSTTNLTLNGTTATVTIQQITANLTAKRSYTLIFRGTFGSPTAPTGRDLRIFTDY